MRAGPLSERQPTSSSLFAQMNSSPWRFPFGWSPFLGIPRLSPGMCHHAKSTKADLDRLSKNAHMRPRRLEEQRGFEIVSPGHSEHIGPSLSARFLWRAISPNQLPELRSLDQPNLSFQAYPFSTEEMNSCSEGHCSELLDMRI